MKILVTGSSGFIGNHLVNLLLDYGCSVLGIDLKIPLEQPNNKNFSFRACDILDKEKLAKVFGDFKPEYCVHLAARTDLREKRDLQYYAINFKGSENIIRAASRDKSIKRVIFTSTQLVCKIGYMPDNENDYAPNTLYGKSKALAEKIIRKNGGGIEWCIVRPTSVWGPGMNAHYRRLFLLIKQNRYLHFGSRPLYKSYGFVGNIAYQYYRLLIAPKDLIHEKTFYLADYEPICLQDWINSFQSALQSRRIKNCPVCLAVILAKIGDVFGLIGFQSIPLNSFRLKNILTEYQYDMEKISQICGPLPFTINDGIKATVDWLKNDLRL